MAVFDGKLRVGIDWENVGLVSFHTSPSTPPNLWRDPLYHSDTYVDFATATVTKNITTGFGDTFVQRTNVLQISLTSAVANEVYLIGSNGSNKNVTINNSTEYTISLWYSNNHASDYTFAIEFFRTSDSTWVAGSSVVAPTSTFGKLTLNATSPSTGTHIRIKITRPNSAVSSIFSIFGIFLTATNTTNHPTHFNAGTSYYTTTFGYDDVTDRVMSFDTTLGKSDWTDLLPSDGQLKITLRNDDKRFSPDYSSSPLYGFIKPNRRIFIELDNDSLNGRGYALWSGWITDISVAPNIYGERTTTITATSGISKLENLPVTPFIFGVFAENPSINNLNVAKKIIVNGWDTPYFSGFMKLGLSKLNGTILYNPSSLIVNSGSGNVGACGYDWDNESASQLIGELQDFFGGYISQNSAGLLVFSTKTIIDAASPTSYAYSDFLIGNELKYGGDIYTYIESDYTLIENNWLSGVHTNTKLLKAPLRIDLSANETKTIEIVFDYNDPISPSLGGRRLTGVTPPNDGFTLESGVAIFKSSDNTLQSYTGFTNIASLLDTHLYAPESDNTSFPTSFYTGYNLTVTNPFNFAVYTYVMPTASAGGTFRLTFQWTGKAYIGDTLTFGVIKRELKNRFVNKIDLFSSYVAIKVSRAQQKKWFPELSFTIEDSTTLTRSIAQSPLSLIRISSEAQTGISNLDQVVIGEKLRFAPQYLERSWILGPKV